MKNNIVFREIYPSEEDNVCKVVVDCFNEFIAPGYSSEGINEFISYVNPVLLTKRLKNGNFLFIALENNVTIGVIEMRNANHISLLFVKKEYHKRGIAKKLVEQSINRCRKINPLLKVIEVNSSPYAVKIYEHMGFIQIDTEQIVNGIKFVPMILNLQ